MLIVLALSLATHAAQRRKPGVREFLQRCDALREGTALQGLDRRRQQPPRMYLSKQLLDSMKAASPSAAALTSPTCVPISPPHGEVRRNATLFFLGAGSTGTTSLAHMCIAAGYKSYHGPYWQELLHYKKYAGLVHLFDRYNCFSDGLVHYAIDPTEVDTELVKAGTRAADDRVSYILNSRPLFPWLVSRFAHALSVAPKYATASHLWTRVRKDGIGGVVGFLHDLIELRVLKHSAVLSYHTHTHRVIFVDATTTPGQMHMALHLGLPKNVSFRQLSDNKYEIGASGELGSLRINDDMGRMLQEVGLNLTSIRAVRELVASVLMVAYPDAASAVLHEGTQRRKLGTPELEPAVPERVYGMCKCPDGYIAV